MVYQGILTPHHHLDEEGTRMFTFYVDGTVESGDLIVLKPNSGRLAFIDRDGVVIEKANYHQQHTSTETIRVMGPASDAIRYLSGIGVHVVLNTNQPGIFRGIMTEQDLCDMTSKIQGDIGGDYIDSLFFCPHPAPDEGDFAPNPCSCRKPGPMMVEAAMKIYGVSRDNMVVFGDFVSDIAAAKMAGVRPVYIATEHDEYDAVQARMREEHPDVLETSFPELYSAVKRIFK